MLTLPQKGCYYLHFPKVNLFSLLIINKKLQVYDNTPHNTITEAFPEMVFANRHNFTNAILRFLFKSGIYYDFKYVLGPVSELT